MRTKRALYITITGMLLQILRSVIQLIVRKIFITTLGAELLGLNSLFSSVMGFLTLSELGIAGAINVYLYKAFAEEDYQQVSTYISLLNKFYRAVGMVVLIGGTLCTPLVLQTINGNFDIKTVIIAYMLFVLATASSYTFAGSGNLLRADQREYIVNIYSGIFFCIVSFFQIIVLIVAKDYYLYLVLNIVNNFCTNLVGYVYSRKHYKEVYRKKPLKLNKMERKGFEIKWKALIVYNFSIYLIQSCDNMIISMIFGTVMVAYYNNYNLVLNMLYAICATLSGSVVAGLGNMLYTDHERMKDIINRLSVVQHLIFSSTGVAMICLSNIFVIEMFGLKSKLSFGLVFSLGILYYYKGYFNLFESVRKSAGLYEKDQWHLLGISVLNIIISVGLSYMIGISGVVIGTIVCYLIKGLHFTPNQVFVKDVVGSEGKREYYTKLIKNTFLYLGEIIISVYIIEKFKLGNIWIDFGVKGLICIIVCTAINYLFYRNSETMKEITYFIKEIIKKRYIRYY